MGFQRNHPDSWHGRSTVRDVEVRRVQRAFPLRLVLGHEGHAGVLLPAPSANVPSVQRARREYSDRLQREPNSQVADPSDI
eukprot:3294169-Pyramimonas_sp.AAC.1